MSEFVRLFEYKQLLSGRRAVPRVEILKRLGTSIPADVLRGLLVLMLIAAPTSSRT